MLRSYLKIALRNLWKHKGYSFINIAGLAVGIACALFILLWVQDETSFDRFHAKAKTIYRLEQDQPTDNGPFHVYVSGLPLGPAIKAGIPGVRETVRIGYPGTLLVRHGDKAFYENRVAAVDPQFFRVFSFPVVQGKADAALTQPGSLVLTEDAARKYFGGADPIGQPVIINNRHAFAVTAVMKGAPANSTLRYDMLVPFEFLKTLGGDYSEGWGSNWLLTWVELDEKSDRAAVEAKITRLVRENTLSQFRGTPENWKKIQADPEQLKRYNSYVAPTYSLNPIVDIRLHGYFGFSRTNPGSVYLNIFSAVALFVLLIACINFMNLATARSASRAREVGLRKVVGALRRGLAGQFYGESLLTALAAGLMALLLVVTLLPAFNSLAGKTLTLASVVSPKFLAGIAAVILVTGIVAGSYPALFLSAFRPARVLKGKVAGGARSALFRKALVVLQFGLSIFLLIGMGGVTRQLDYMRTKKLGYEKEQLVYLPLRGETQASYAAFKERLLRDPRIQGVTATQQEPTSISSNSGGADWDGKRPEQSVLIGFTCVDFDYTETFKIDLAAGRPFSRTFGADAGKTFLVNEEVPKVMGLDPASAVGKRFSFLGVDGTIVGVMKNFHYQSVRASIEPFAVIIAPESLNYAVVRLKAGEIPKSLDAVKATWESVNPSYPFDYRFFDQDFDVMYRADARMGAVLRVFSVLAIFIACLGLFGLAAFTAEQRTKEIGVRKVLGASAPGIVLLLAKEFVQWVLVANLLAWPVAYLVTKNWLQGFAYRTEPALGLFAAAGAGALLLALLTVGFQAIRAALSNPVDALKYE
jgi:putative ABC transport system permease protein